jgi:Cdc6-like AAA superfamily ATPase
MTSLWGGLNTFMKIKSKKLKFKMIVKENQISNYVGARAIFDPNYIPQKILFRKREVDSLFSILNDSFSDNFCLNVLYQGIQGIGKKVIINRVIKNLSIQNKYNLNLKKITVDCKQKNFNEVIISILAEINSIFNFDLDLNLLINLDISDLWNLFKLACKKIDSHLLLIFNNIENIKPDLFKKFLYYGKEQKISLISTINNVLKPSTLDLSNSFDLKKKLGYYSYKELFEILKQRASVTFLKPIDKEFFSIITDLIFEHYVPVPGKGIEILRDSYPILNDEIKYDNLDLLEIVQSHFDMMQITDEFNLLSYISEEELLTIIFLDNLSNYFLQNHDYYINSKELKDIYYISCEAIEYEKDLEIFHNIIVKLQSVGILSYSKRSVINDYKILPNDKINASLFFLVINPKRLKSIVDAIFNNYNFF